MSLNALMQDRRNNPMKFLPKLNKFYNWNMPGVKQVVTQQVISSDNLPKLGNIPNDGKL